MNRLLAIQRNMLGFANSCWKFANVGSAGNISGGWAMYDASPLSDVVNIQYSGMSAAIARSTRSP